jgi:glycosyltransferase involved in cell wall biosynthesis
MFVVVSDRWNAAAGGRERYAEDLVAHLATEGRQVITAVRGQRMPDACTGVLALTPTRHATHYQLHGGLAAEAFAAERASLRSAVRRLLFYPALRCNRRRLRLLDDETRVLGGNAVLMAFSRSIARGLVERYGVAASRITLSRPGVNLRLFHPPAGPRPASDRGLRLVFVAHNFALKGLASAIAATACASRAGVHLSLSVAGRGRTGMYRRLAARLGVSECLSFLGPLSQRQVADLFRASEALLHPTFYDPFPRVAIEALACGRPVITTASCGAAEILTPGIDGVVVPDATAVDALAAAIVSLAEPPTLRRMQAAATETGRRFDEVEHFRQTSQWLFEAGPSA